MVQPHELRIGNWLLQKRRNGFQYVQCNCDILAQMCEDEATDLYPVRLNYTLLEKCGFKKGELTITDVLYLWWDDEQEAVFLKYDWHLLNPKLIHLHQLQNFYFMLTGKELRIRI